MYILEKVKKQIVKTINEALGGKLIQASDLVYPPNPEMGDLSLPCFDLAKKLEKNPNETVSELIRKVKPNEVISGAKVAGPYFNIILNKDSLVGDVLKQINNQKEEYGKNEKLRNKKIMVEFAHPNPFKSFHIGHLRNIILGESLVRILEFHGAKVIRTNYQGDVGMHIAKCLWAFREVNEKKYPKVADEKVALLGKCYARGAKAFEESKVDQEMIKLINKKIYARDDEEINKLWEIGKNWSLEKFHEIYERVYSHFDREYMESEMIDSCVKYINQALKKGILEVSDGAVIFNGKKYGIDTRVFLNSEGLPTYEGKELGLAYKEFTDFGKIDLCLHNVAVEQISFFKVTFKVQELLDDKMFKGKQYHNAYEFVGLKKGKMSSRKGEVVLGNDILNEANDRIKGLVKEKGVVKDIKEVSEKISIGAIKYSFLKINPFKYLAFDMDESVNFEGDSGPYIQYTYVRICSIIKKTENINQITEAKYSDLTDEKEYKIVLILAKYSEIVKKAGDNYDPSEITKYLFELSQQFNDYYHNVPILKAEEKVRLARLSLIISVSQIIKNGLNLLGIEVVEEM